MNNESWKHIICAPHLTFEGACRATLGWLQHAESELRREGATQLRLTIGEDGAIFFNCVEVR